MADLLPCPFCGGQPKVGETNTGVPGMEDCGYAFVECCIVHAHSEESVEDAIAAWNRRHSGGDGEDSARLDYIERTFSGMTNRERYLPVVMIWGKGANGRTLREACDKYRAKDAARAGERGVA